MTAVGVVVAVAAQAYGGVEPLVKNQDDVLMAWIVVMAAICYIGIELSARTQVVLLSFEIVTLGIFAVVALVKVASGDAAGTDVDPSFSWINPFEIDSFSALTSGILIAIFIYRVET